MPARPSVSGRPPARLPARAVRGRILRRSSTMKLGRRGVARGVVGALDGAGCAVEGHLSG